MAKLINLIEGKLKNNWVIFGLSLLVATAIFYPALFGGKVIGTDAIELNIPQLSFYKSALLSGETPFWNPYLAVGFPNFISIQGFPYAPLNWLLLLLSPIAVHYIGITLTIALGIFFAILFFRELGISSYGSVVGSLAYLVGNIHFARDLVLATAILIQAVLFWAILKIHKSDNFSSYWRFCLLGILAVGYGLLLTSYFPLLYVFTGLVAFALFLIITSFNRRAAFKKIFLAIFIIFAIGAIIGSLQIIPTYVLTKFSQRSGGFGAEALAGYAVSFRELVHFFFLTPRGWLDTYLYLGMIPLLCFFMSFWSKNIYAKFFRWLFFVALAISIKGSPIFWLIVHLPVFNFFEGAARFMLVGVFGAGALVGLGFDYLREQLGVQWTRRFIIQSVSIGSVVVLILAHSFLFYSERTAWESIVLSGIFLILTAATLLAGRRYKNIPIVSLLVILTLLECVVIFYNFNKNNTFDKKEYTSGPMITEYLHRNPGRVLPVFVDDWDDVYFQNLKLPPPAWSDFQDSTYIKFPTFYPNYNMVTLVKSAEINDPLLNIDMGRMLALVGTRQLVTTGGEEKLNKLRLTKGTRDDSTIGHYYILKSRSALLDFLGIRYLLSALAFNNKDLDLGSTQNWKLIGHYSLEMNTGTGILTVPVYAYENLSRKPLAYLTPITGTAKNSAESFGLFKESNFTGIYIECPDCKLKSLSGDGEVVLNKSETGAANFKVVVKEEQFLVFTQNYLPGWRAYIDGREVEIHKVNSVFPGIFIPAGEHNVEFVYNYWDLFNLKLIFGNSLTDVK